MMLRNDYERGLFNGDQGLILSIRDAGQRARPMAVFQRKDGFVAFEPASLGADITHSFAMTVHKSQGSEYDHAALILPERESPLVTRELLYTAMTRSRRSVVILSRRERLMEGIQRRVQRFSRVGTRRGRSSIGRE